MAQARALLTDAQQTAFFFVTLPESLPIAVITRFIEWFREFGIPVGGVIVNGLIQQDQLDRDTAAFVRNRVQMQDEHMARIAALFGDQVRARVPLFEAEVRGLEMLKRTAAYLFPES